MTKKHKSLSITLKPELLHRLDSLSLELNQSSSQIASELLEIALQAREEELEAEEKEETQERIKQRLLWNHHDASA